MKTIRAFLAINLDLAIVRSIAEEQRELKQSCEAAGLRVRWVPPPNMHVTIRFLGQVTEPMISAVKDVLEPMTRALAQFEVESAGLGAFPDVEHARVVWSGLRCPSGDLERLYDKVSELLDQTGFPTEKRPFKSHVTIGRIKDRSSAGLGDCLEQSGTKEHGVSTIRDLICYRSDLQPTGADYHALWRLPLLGRGAGSQRPAHRNGNSTTDTKE